MAQHPFHHGIIWKLADLNRQALEWCDVVANAWVYGTTHRVPWEMLAEERPHLGKLPDRATLVPYLRGGPQGVAGTVSSAGRAPCTASTGSG